MSATTGSSDSSDLKHLEAPALAMTSEAIARDFTRYFGHTLGRRLLSTEAPYVYQALALTLRDRLVERWNKTSNALRASNGRKTYYLSLEFLIGRLMRNTMLNLDLEDACREAMASMGLSMADVFESEQDAGLGNGGLGRLAACFLDSCATLGLPVVGYGIRYHYGMFRQCMEDGRQIEEPDQWLRDGFIWEIERREIAQTVKFGGRTEVYTDDGGQIRHRWVDTHDVLAVPYDVPVPGYRNEVVNTLRLWSAGATDAFDLEEFNAGSYTDAVAAKNAAENITMVLYPNASSENGQTLRLQQQYFLASASLKDTLRQWVNYQGPSFDDFAARHCFQLNDTHPAVAVPELMRLLMDEHGLGWDEAWKITTATMAYTNHTLLPEALEMWPVSLFGGLLPRILEIIFEINARFLSQVDEQFPDDPGMIERMSLIREGHESMVRMAYLAIVGSFSVNGVAELHSRLLREGLFSDFSRMWPQKFNNKTNGVTQRRWLAACNPQLATLITDTIGERWVSDLDRLEDLRPHATDTALGARWRDIKQTNKLALANLIAQRTDVQLPASMLFDVQVKRIHEYKRQLLNVLHAIYLYDQIKHGHGDDMTPRAIIIGGKAAPGYEIAKLIIKFANNVARVINRDPATKDRLRLVFVPDYNVSVMEVICPAADLSEQISTAGKEASGTGNMKFMMNGALTIGTLDGANVEILEAVGAENFFLFGLDVEQVDALRPNYDPAAIVQADEGLARVVGMIRRSCFNRFEPGVFDPIVQAILSPFDPWMTAADFRSFVDTQANVATAYTQTQDWTRMSILNTASSGRFSTDRTMRDYNDDIWHLEPIKL
ncbi:MAG: glycogen/starch/alpha-glucan phosphorylase [Gammaproteobacteria bacterium]